MINEIQIGIIKTTLEKRKALCIQKNKLVESFTYTLNKTLLASFENMQISRVFIDRGYSFKSKGDKYCPSVRFEVKYIENGKEKFGHGFDVQLCEDTKITKGSMNSSEKSYMYTGYVYGQFCKMLIDGDLAWILTNELSQNVFKICEQLSDLETKQRELNVALELALTETTTFEVGKSIEYDRNKQIIEKVGREYIYFGDGGKSSKKYIVARMAVNIVDTIKEEVYKR